MKVIVHFWGKHEAQLWRLWFRAVLGIGLAFLSCQVLGQQNATEDQVKAAYLLNFAKLAEWPRRALPDGPSPLVVGVSGGDEEFLNVLKADAAGKIVGSHPLAVKAVSSEEDMKSCTMVFFRASAKKHAPAALEGLAKAGVLLVGEDDSFLRQGGMINLMKDHGVVRFAVNSDTLDRSEIHFSTKILALAKADYNPPSSTEPLDGSRRLERSVPPEYPDIAARMKLTGTAQVRVTVKPDGAVEEVTILGGHPLLADALARAVKHWKYQPAPKATVEVVKYTFGPQ